MNPIIVTMFKSFKAAKKNIWWKTAIPVLAGGVMALLPAPEGLEQNAWYYFALFSAVILALMLEPIPPAAVGFIGVTAAAVLALVHT
ncbi:anion permease, partial [Acidobacteriota bacterium]